MPAVSIIIPVYMAERYIRKCIDSVLAQTFTDFELILVDDGSPDNSGSICDEYALKDARIHVIHLPNSGVSTARNAGLDYATGEFIYFVDSDDWIAPDLLKDNVAVLEEQQADVVVFNYTEIYKDRTVEHKPTSQCIKGDLLTLFNKLPVVVWCKLYRSSIWKSIRFPVGLKHEDDYVNPQVVVTAQKVVCNDKNYYYYNKTNENSIMAGMNITRRYNYFLCGLQNIKAVEGRFPELYPYAVSKAFDRAFKAWNSNVYTHYLTNEQQQEIEEFIDKYSKDKKLLPFYLKVQLFGYYHCRFINKLKGLYYLRKYRAK